MASRLSKLLVLCVLLAFPAWWPAATAPQHVDSTLVGQAVDWTPLATAVDAQTAWYAALPPPTTTTTVRRSGTVSAAATSSTVSYEPGSIQQLICTAFGDACRPAVTVARCESTFHPDAVNGPNRGVFQINQVHADQWAAVTGVDYWSSWMDPATNIAFARWLYEQSGWGSVVMQTVTRPEIALTESKHHPLAGDAEPRSVNGTAGTSPARWSPVSPPTASVDPCCPTFISSG